jgi:hypothetical protein
MTAVHTPVHRNYKDITINIHPVLSSQSVSHNRAMRCACVQQTDAPTSPPNASQRLCRSSIDSDVINERECRKKHNLFRKRCCVFWKWNYVFRPLLAIFRFPQYFKKCLQNWVRAGRWQRAACINTLIICSAIVMCEQWESVEVRVFCMGIFFIGNNSTSHYIEYYMLYFNSIFILQYQLIHLLVFITVPLPILSFTSFSNLSLYIREFYRVNKLGKNFVDTS